MEVYSAHAALLSLDIVGIVYAICYYYHTKRNGMWAALKYSAQHTNKLLVRFFCVDIIYNFFLRTFRIAWYRLPICYLIHSTQILKSSCFLFISFAKQKLVEWLRFLYLFSCFIRFI